MARGIGIEMPRGGRQSRCKARTSRLLLYEVHDRSLDRREDGVAWAVTSIGRRVGRLEHQD